MKLVFLGKLLFANKIIRHVSYWFVLILFFTIIWGTYDDDYFRNLMIQIFSLPSRLLLVYGTLYAIIPLLFLKKKYLNAVITYVVLLLAATILIQRPIMLFYVQPTYLHGWEISSFFTITEIMNTALDVNISAVIPVGYTLFKFWQKTNQKTLELEKQQQELHQQKDFIYVKVEKSLQKVYMKDIIYIESLKNYIKIKTTEREIIAYKSISSMQESLPKKKFLRVHRSYIVGINFIDSFSPSKLMLKSISIPIGRKYKEEVKAVLGYF